MGKDERMQKVFKRLFLRLSLTVITPILLLICTFLIIMESLAADDYVESNSRIASSVCESINNYISARTNVAYTFSSNYSVTLLAAKADETILDLNTACQNIKSSLASIQDSGSIFSLTAIYFPERDIVVSSRSTKLTLDTFYNRYLGLSGMTHEEFGERIKRVGYYAYIPATEYSAQSGESGRRITFVSPVQLDYISPRAILIYALEETKLSNMITGSFSADILYRLTASDGACLSKSDALGDFTPNGNTAKLNGQSYYLFTRRFSSTGITYEILVPSSIVLRVFHTIELLLLGGMLLCLALGILIAKKTTRRIYAPFENLMEASFPEGGNQPIRHMTEGLNLIASKILTDRSQNEKMRAELGNYYKAARENALILLITQSEYLEEEELEKLLDILELSKERCFIQLALIKTKSADDSAHALDTLSAHPYIHTARLSSQRIAAVSIRFTQEASETAPLETELASLAPSYEIALSTVHEGLRSLNACLNEAVSALSGDNDDSPESEDNAFGKILYPLDKQLNLIALIVNGRQAEAQTLLSEIITANRDYLKCTEAEMERLYSQLLGTAEKAADQMQL